MTAPPAGVLEELDGGPIRPRPVPSRAMAWPRAIAAASVVAASRPRLWPFALVAFLARGGFVALLIPMLVLPSFVGLSNIVGPTSVTAAGPTPRLIALTATWLAIALGALVVGTLVAAAAEVSLYRATVAQLVGRRPADFPSMTVVPTAHGMRRIVLRVAAIRLLLMLAVLLALAAAVPAWIQVAYRELLLPTDLAVPLPVRVIAGAPLQGAVAGAVWLAAEVTGGLAARRIALHGASASAALGAAVGEAARAPVPVLLTLALAVAGTLLVLVPAGLVVGIAWDRARIALVDGREPGAVVASTMLLVVAWGGCLVVAGASAAWRSVLWTVETGRRTRTG